MSDDDIQIDCVAFRFLAEPGDVNFGGKVHGGAVMKWLDQAGFACASGWAREYCVTIYVGGIHFVRPIKIGEIVEVNAKVIHTGKTSIHLMLNVKSKKPKGGNYKVNTHCLMVFVAVDAYGNKTAVPKWNPVTSREIAAEKFALNYIKLRQKAESNIADFTVFP